MPQIYLDLPGMDKAAGQNKLYQSELEQAPAKAEMLRSHADLYGMQAGEMRRKQSDELALRDMNPDYVKQQAEIQKHQQFMASPEGQRLQSLAAYVAANAETDDDARNIVKGVLPTLSAKEQEYIGDPNALTKAHAFRLLPPKAAEDFGNWQMKLSGLRQKKEDEVLPTPQLYSNPKSGKQEVWFFTKTGQPSSYVRTATQSDLKEKTSPDDTIVLRQTVKDLPKMKQDANLAANSTKNIDEALNLIDTGQVTGKGGALLAWIAPYAESVGIKSTGMDDAAKFNAITKLIRGPMRAEIIGPGQVSNYEQQLLNEMGGGGGAAKEAAKSLLEYYRGAAEMKVDTYNQELSGAVELAPSLSKIHKPISLQRRNQGVLTEGYVRGQLEGKGITGPDQDAWVAKYRQAGKVR